MTSKRRVTTPRVIREQLRLRAEDTVGFVTLADENVRRVARACSSKRSRDERRRPVGSRWRTWRYVAIAKGRHHLLGATTRVLPMLYRPTNQERTSVQSELARACGP